MGVIASVSSTLSFGLVNGQFFQTALSAEANLVNRWTHRNGIWLDCTLFLRYVHCTLDGGARFIHAVKSLIMRHCHKSNEHSWQNECRTLLFCSQIGTGEVFAIGQLDNGVGQCHRTSYTRLRDWLHLCTDDNDCSCYRHWWPNGYFIWRNLRHPHCTLVYPWAALFIDNKSLGEIKFDICPFNQCVFFHDKFRFQAHVVQLERRLQ